MEALLGHLARIGCDVIACAPAHADWRRDDAVVRAFERARLVVVNGEGTLHHDRPAGTALLAAGARAKALGIPAALVNAGWEANGPDYLAAARDFALVAVRDSASAAPLRAAGVACRIVADLSLDGAAPGLAQTRHGVLVGDSVDRRVAARLDRLRRQLGARSAPILARAPGLAGAFRHLRGGGAREDLARPLALAAQLRGRAVQLGAMAPTPAALLDRLARAELLVSGRFHGCTLALVARTPFVAVPSNTSKIEALVADCGLDPRRVAAALAPESVEQARRAGWSPAERDAVEAYLDRARADAARLFDDVRALA
jgi:polysaccharide pyruvyl transferase WcaK-like protein